MTDGAARIDTDLHMLAKITKIAFNKFFKSQQIAFPNSYNQQDYLQPRNDIAVLKPFGIEATPGVARRPIITEQLWKDLRRHVYKAAMHRQNAKDSPIGWEYFIKNKQYELYMPSALAGTNRQIEAVIARRRGAKPVSEVATPTCHKQDLHQLKNDREGKDRTEHSK